jgi:hypothetical protein
MEENFVLLYINNNNNKMETMETDSKNAYDLIVFILKLLKSSYDYNVCMDYIEKNFPLVAFQLVLVQRTVGLFLTADSKVTLDTLILNFVKNNHAKQYDFLKSMFAPTKSTFSFFHFRKNNTKILDIVNAHRSVYN